MENGAEVVTVTGGRACLPLQGRTLAAAFIVTTGNFQVKSTVCKQLSAPEMGEIYFLLVEWDTEGIGLLH